VGGVSFFWICWVGDSECESCVGDVVRILGFGERRVMWVWRV
jgi:hypothetical protein